MREVEETEAAASVGLHTSNEDERRVLVEPHPKWSRDLGDELLRVAQLAAQQVTVPVAAGMMLIGQALRAHVIGMVHRAELVEYNDGHWYRDNWSEITAPDGSRLTKRTLHKCGGPYARCDCYYHIRDGIRSLGVVEGKKQ